MDFEQRARQAAADKQKRDEERARQISEQTARRLKEIAAELDPVMERWFASVGMVPAPKPRRILMDHMHVRLMWTFEGRNYMAGYQVGNTKLTKPCIEVAIPGAPLSNTSWLPAGTLAQIGEALEKEDSYRRRRL